MAKHQWSCCCRCPELVCMVCGESADWEDMLKRIMGECEDANGRNAG